MFFCKKKTRKLDFTSVARRLDIQQQTLKTRSLVWPHRFQRTYSRLFRFWSYLGRLLGNHSSYISTHFKSVFFTLTQCLFFGIFVQKLFFIQKAVNLSSKSLLALTKEVSTCFEDFMKISGHFWPPSCT